MVITATAGDGTSAAPWTLLLSNPTRSKQLLSLTSLFPQSEQEVRYSLFLFVVVFWAVLLAHISFGAIVLISIRSKTSPIKRVLHQCMADALTDPEVGHALEKSITGTLHSKDIQGQMKENILDCIKACRGACLSQLAVTRDAAWERWHLFAEAHLSGLPLGLQFPWLKVGRSEPVEEPSPEDYQNREREKRRKERERKEKRKRN